MGDMEDVVSVVSAVVVEEEGVVDGRWKSRCFNQRGDARVREGKGSLGCSAVKAELSRETQSAA